jgi:hypothetical protein
MEEWGKPFLEVLRETVNEPVSFGLLVSRPAMR